ncbi:type VI secretion system-associated protein TagF [Zoogloea sp. LCSB751]|uniref:type VI secretion system-associated protein TagF n=1 Tax=Zoogloea sp. LCSB751 TaxID=1965277 RepID=UPI0009A4D472|nr:type VI secretion system-associated protein TagF [Zoogloea sp. LCSB751]
MIQTYATYYGKLAGHADFISENGQQKLISLIDAWLSRAMEQLSHYPDWKSSYDNAGAIDFAFVSQASQLTLIGSLRPSRDTSGRRFPFLIAATIPRDDIRLFRCAPSALGNSYTKLSKLTDAAVNGIELNVLQNELSQLNCAHDFDNAITCDPLGNFVRETTLEELSLILGGKNTSQSVARTLLSIGLVMQQLLTSTNTHIDKELELPLPHITDEKYWNVAGLWLYLITAFIRNPTTEIQIIIKRDIVQPRMFIGLNGSAAHPLCTALMGTCRSERNVCLINPEWVSTPTSILYHSSGISKLTSYLAQPTLSLERIIGTFRETFLKA